MKLEVTKWVIDFVLKLLSKIIEIAFRVILFLLPMGLFLILVQFRKKISKVSNLSVYTTEHSVWQHIFPGFALVAFNPEQFRGVLLDKKSKFQLWVSDNKYILSFLFMLVIVVLMYLKG